MKDSLWDWEDLGRALKNIGRRSSAEARLVAPVTDERFDEPDSIDRWIQFNAEYLGFEVEEKDASFHSLEYLLQGIGPGLIEITAEGKHSFLVLLKSRGGVLHLLGREGTVHRVPVEKICGLLLAEAGSPCSFEIERILKAANVPISQRYSKRAAFLRECSGSVPIHGIWQLSLPAGSNFWRQICVLKLPRRLFAFFGLYLLKYVFWLGGWWLMGQSALNGRMDRAWVIAWVILQLTIIPLDLLSNWTLGIFTLGVSTLLRRRLLAGTLRLDPEEVRLDGTGQHLSRIMESELLESNLLSGAFLAVLGMIDLLFAAIVLAQGTSGMALSILFGSWTMASLVILWNRSRVDRRLTDHRVEMSQELVEKMVGHRTRLAQEMELNRHNEEDEQLERYLKVLRQFDRNGTRCSVLIPRGWMLLGLVGLGIGFSHNTPYGLTTSLGGILLGSQALSKLAGGVSDLASAWIAWDKIAFIFKAAARPVIAGSRGILIRSQPTGAMPLIEAHELTFQYGNRTEPAVSKCDVTISVGDRILLEGPSGSGKSTLASVLGGLRCPTGGILLSRGLDRQTIGSSGWHRRVAVVPQFHENYMFNDTLAFNLLMSRRWPLRDQDLKEAESLCRKIGLGELLDRMPGGLSEMLGESGWQLSHGERSRLFIARALLQLPEVLIIDEGLTSLDSESSESTLRAVLDSTPAVLAIAHR